MLNPETDVKCPHCGKEIELDDGVWEASKSPEMAEDGTMGCAGHGEMECPKCGENFLVFAEWALTRAEVVTE